MDILGLLPVELSQQILGFLPAWDLGSCTRVSRCWRSLADCSVVWRKKCLSNGWSDTQFISEKRTHYVEVYFAKDNSKPLWTLNDWALNYAIHYKLPRSWNECNSRNYLLSPEDSHITTFSCDGHHLAVGHASGTVSILNVRRVPFMQSSTRCLIPGYRIHNVQIKGSYLVVLQSMLLQIFKNDGMDYKFIDAKSFELGYPLIELVQKYEQPIETFSEWYCDQVKYDKYTKEKISHTIIFHMVHDILYVLVRDYQMIYGWSMENGKRVYTIHIPSTTCKLREFVIHDNTMYIVYASGNVRHITVYDMANKTFIYELTTPECKTQKVIVGQYLVGIAISGPGMTSNGVLKVWDKTNGKEVATRRTGYVTFKTVALLYDLIAYGELTTVYVWEPKTNSILKSISLGEGIAYLFPCPFKFVLVVGDISSYVCDWVVGMKLYRVYHQIVKSCDYRGLLYVDETMLLLKLDNSMVEMKAFC